MSEKVIEAKNITLIEGKQNILDIDNFSVDQGETVALIGPNGAGKSTFLKVLMLLQRPTSGELFFKGEKIAWKKSISYRRRMAMVFQEPLLLDTTVYNNVASGLRIRSIDKKTIPGKVEDCLKRLGIEHLSNRSVRYLSGGESQRVSIARALAMEPEVLFLDEPFSALDAPTRMPLTVEIARILRDNSITSVFVTHDYSEIPLLAGTVAVLEKGSIVQMASSRQVLTRPINRTVASLVGVENTIPGRIVGKDGREFSVQAGPHMLKASVDAVPPGEKVYILLRPEDVRLSTEKTDNNINSVRGKIRELLPHGCQFKAVVNCGFPLIAMLNPDQVFGGEAAVGNEVCLNFSSTKVHLIERAE